MGCVGVVMALVVLIGDGLPVADTRPEWRGPLGCRLGALAIHGPMDADEFDRRLAKVDRNDPATAGDVLEILAPVVYNYPTEEKWLMRRLGTASGDVLLALVDDPREEVQLYALQNLSDHLRDADALRRAYQRHLGKVESDWVNVGMAIKLRALGDATPDVIDVIASQGGEVWHRERDGGVSDFSIEEFMLVAESLLDPGRSDEQKAHAAWALRAAPEHRQGHQDLIARLLPELNADDADLRFWSAVGLLWLRYYDEDVERELLAQCDRDFRLQQQIVPALLTWEPHDPRRLEPFVDAILDNLKCHFFLDHQLEDLSTSIFLPYNLFKGVSLSREQKDKLVPLIQNSSWHNDIVRLIRESEIQDGVLGKEIAGYVENLAAQGPRQIIRRFPDGVEENPFNQDPEDDPFGDPEDPFGD